MSKMRMPEMSVVRFTESDVIVASGILRTVELVNFTDSVSETDPITAKNNGYIRIGNDIYGSSQGSGRRFEDAYGLYSNFGGSSSFWWGESALPSGTYPFSTMVTNDSNGLGMAGADGTYTWNGSVFTKQ